MSRASAVDTRGLKSGEKLSTRRLCHAARALPRVYPRNLTISGRTALLVQTPARKRLAFQNKTSCSPTTFCFPPGTYFWWPRDTHLTACLFSSTGISRVMGKQAGLGSELFSQLVPPPQGRNLKRDTAPKQNKTKKKGQDNQKYFPSLA